MTIERLDQRIEAALAAEQRTELAFALARHGYLRSPVEGIKLCWLEPDAEYEVEYQYIDMNREAITHIDSRRHKAGPNGILFFQVNFSYGKELLQKEKGLR